MGADSELDFTSLLDELLAASSDAESRDDAGAAAPSLRVDMLAQIERLQAENLALFPDRAMDAYEQSAEAAPPPDGGGLDGGGKETPAHLQPALEDLFFLDPESISRELGIKPRSKPEDLDRARRTFAMRYHPDRVPEEHRERAVLRMQIANMLIDQAKRAGR